MILVDSDVLIEHLRGNTAAREWLVQARRSSGPLAISVVSLTEIAGGMRSPERREVMRLLGSMRRFEVGEAAGAAAVLGRACALAAGARRVHGVRIRYGARLYGEFVFPAVAEIVLRIRPGPRASSGHRSGTGSRPASRVRRPGMRVRIRGP